MASPERTPASSPGEPAESPAALREELKRFIVEHLRLPDVQPSDLADDALLVDSDLDLDSIDVLELVTGVEKKYGVRFEDPEMVQRVFTSVNSIASHIASQRGPA
jgi:acyl carrier protein